MCSVPPPSNQLTTAVPIGIFSIASSLLQRIGPMIVRRARNGN
jgi:hypothetical protein